jgi:hypothetical protein
MVDEPTGRVAWCAVVDTAQDPSLADLVRRSAQQQCLISGALPAVLAATLPYVVQLGTGEPLTEAWKERGVGKNWGILFQTDEPLDQLRLHFKKFLNARLPDGTIALFRFYDPRVFRVYIAAATPDERAPWFRGIMRYSIEGGDPGQFHDFRLENGRLYDGNMLVES